MSISSDFDLEQKNYLNRELLRFSTAGSVDDGKSTLIGRLLYDSKQIFQDQMDALEQASKLRGEEQVNLALLTDGLRAEREQGITIDVAYRYFSTPKRKFIIADTPGHEQYTRNMVTGASTSQLSIILIDARNGIVTQSKRHGIIASLLGIPHLIIAINKMDLVDYKQERFEEIVREYTEFSQKLNIHDIKFIPISALNGDNVVEKSSSMAWYQGSTILGHLENVTIAADRNLVDFRLPIQYVIRPHQDFRGFSGRIVSGTIQKGEQIIVLPSKQKSRISELITLDGNLEEAFAGQSVVVTLEDELDISRGDMIVRTNNVPEIKNLFEANLCWMDDSQDLNTKSFYYLRHTTRELQAYIRDLRYVIDVNSLHRKNQKSLSLNEIGKVLIETAHPIFHDPYSVNRETGSFVLIDPHTNLTIAAGMIRHDKAIGFENNKSSSTQISSNVRWENKSITQHMREVRQGHKGYCLWLTGLSGSGKSTIAKGVEQILFEQGKQVYLLDGDNIRHGLNGDLGFSDQDRIENIRRAGHVARLFVDAGFIVICSFISPLQKMRDDAKALFPKGSFSEIYIKCSIEECFKRDPKGLYKKVQDGEILQFTGVDSSYEPPINCDYEINSESMSESESIQELIRFINLELKP